MDYTVHELVSLAGEGTLAEAALKIQSRQTDTDPETLRAQMAGHLHMMRESVSAGLDPALRSVSGLTGGQASLLSSYQSRQPLCGSLLGKATTYALAVAEYNACMGKIVAAPTAGACGILPGALMALSEERQISDDQLVDALFTAAAIGQAIAFQASISGAEGGCQAECGSAAAMTAAALTELMGGTPQMASDACAFALMNTLGLVCDPAGGLVEVPCVYRNVGSVGNAFTAADLALSGVRSPIPADEMILAMKEVGDALPASLRETGEGGCAACPSMRQCFPGFI